MEQFAGVRMGERKRAGRDESEKRTIIAAAPKTVGAARARRGHALAGRPGDFEAAEKGTLVSPLMNLPPFPAAPMSPASPGVWRDEPEQGEALLEPAATPAPVARRRADTEARALATYRPAQTLGVRERIARVRRLRAEGVVYIPGRRLTRPFVPGAVRARVARSFERAGFVRMHKQMIFLVATLTILLGTVLGGTSTLQSLTTWAALPWAAHSGALPAPTPIPPPAPDILDAGHYMATYGFDWPRNTQPIPRSEFNRLTFMLPYAYSATAAYDHRYGASIEPELVVWWTHAEGISGHINYSNCANHQPRPGTTYFTNIENCAQSSFWQLGYGNQFSVIYMLNNAFRDMHGNPNDAKLVQQVGQWVLDYDRSQGTVPHCGGYPCTFPALTIDQIMSGIDQTTGVVNESNWWASVLSRDPAINCYMIAHALTYFNHNATRNWHGCYYVEPCWGYESNRLGDILAAWGSLRRAAHL